MKLAEFYDANVPDGLGALADAMKTWVHRENPLLFSQLDFDDDTAFLDPLVFAAASGVLPRGRLGQVLLPYVPPDHRRRLGPIAVSTDATGRVHLPGVGFLCFHRAETELLLEWGRGVLPTALLNGQVVAFETEQILVAPRTAIEICQDSALDALFVADDGTRVAVDVRTAGAGHVATVGRAMEVLESACAFYRELIGTTRRICLFDNGELNSFASMAAHGTAFINLRYGLDEVYLVEDLVHQSGHILFSSATVDRKSLFDVSPDATLADLFGAEGDERTVYVALHGLTTESMMCETLNYCYQNRVFDGRQHREVLGRLAYAVTRLYLDLRMLNTGGVFSSRGQALFVELLDRFRDLRDKCAPLVNQLDTSNQPYNFSYERFCELNPPSRVDDLIAIG